MLRSDSQQLVVTARAGRPDASARRFGMRVTAAAGGQPGVLNVFGDIGGIYDWWTGEEVGNSVQGLIDAIQAFGDNDFTIRIHSFGGNAFEGLGLYTLIKACKGNVTVEVIGVCASAATMILMAGDVRRGPGNCAIMIHNPATEAWGTAVDLQKAIDLLGTVRESMIAAYLEGNPSMERAALESALDAETWYTGLTAAAVGILTEVTADAAVTASADPAAVAKMQEQLGFKALPAEAVAQELTVAASVEEEEPGFDEVAAEGAGETAPEGEAAPTAAAETVEPAPADLVVLDPAKEKPVANLLASARVLGDEVFAAAEAARVAGSTAAGIAAEMRRVMTARSSKAPEITSTPTPAAEAAAEKPKAKGLDYAAIAAARAKRRGQ